MFARNSELTADVYVQLEKLSTSTMLNGQDLSGILVKVRIGIDNMIANGFETGYAAAIDDMEPGKSINYVPGQPKKLFGIFKRGE
jgi:hypothetical protein